MRNLIILIFLALSVNGYGQDTENAIYNSRLKVSPIQFGNSHFEFSYERFFGNNKSFTISPTIMLKRNNFEEFKGIQLELQYRVYLKRLNSIEHSTWIFSNIDLYAGLYANGLTYDEDRTEWGDWDPVTMTQVVDSYNKTVVGGETGVFVGLQLNVAKRIVIDFTVGGAVRYTEIDDEFEDAFSTYNYYYDVFDLEYYGVKPKLNLQLGITL
ncbi:MAG: hypothetical protein HKN09_04995 [Saprospiraceae bacterium]|nr:hypothetical protein [Saprospiraceae bacterium]